MEQEQPFEQEPTYISLSDVRDTIGGGQVQYISFYLMGIAGRPNLGQGLRYREEEPGNYHSIVMHPDDVDEFIRRYKEAKGIV